MDDLILPFVDNFTVLEEVLVLLDAQGPQVEAVLVRRCFDTLGLL